MAEGGHQREHHDACDQRLAAAKVACDQRLITQVVANFGMRSGFVISVFIVLVRSWVGWRSGGRYTKHRRRRPDEEERHDLESNVFGLRPQMAPTLPRSEAISGS